MGHKKSKFLTRCASIQRVASSNPIMSRPPQSPCHSFSPHPFPEPLPPRTCSLMHTTSLSTLHADVYREGGGSSLNPYSDWVLEWWQGYNLTYRWVPVGQAVAKPAQVTMGPEELRRRRHASQVGEGKGQGKGASFKGQGKGAYRSSHQSSSSSSSSSSPHDAPSRAHGTHAALPVHAKRRGGGRRSRRKGMGQAGGNSSTQVY